MPRPLPGIQELRTARPFLRAWKTRLNFGSALVTSTRLAFPPGPRIAKNRPLPRPPRNGPGDALPSRPRPRQQVTLERAAAFVSWMVEGRVLIPHPPHPEKRCGKPRFCSLPAASDAGRPSIAFRAGLSPGWPLPPYLFQEPFPRTFPACYNEARIILF